MTRRRLKARRMRKMVINELKMKVKMEVQAEDVEDYFNNVHKALINFTASYTW